MILNQSALLKITAGIALTALLIIALAAVAYPPEALAEGKVDYLAMGRRYYERKEYKEAAEKLRLAIYDKKSSAAVWLLLGQSYQKSGEIGAARQAYQCVQKYFAGSPQSRLAAEAISSLPLTLVRGGHLDGAKAPAKVLPAVTSQGTVSLKDRIFIVPPRFGHAPVSAGTVTLVKNVIAALPEQIYKILDQGQVKIFVTPNLIDKFPDAVNATHPVLGTYLSAEYGRTYERDAYVCESLAAVPGGTDLAPPMVPELIKANAYTMLAHALDYCLESPAKDEQFLRLHREDIADRESNSHASSSSSSSSSSSFSSSTSEPLRAYFLKDQSGANETFAALASSIMGNESPLSRQVDRAFPRSRAWIQARLQVLARKKGI